MKERKTGREGGKEKKKIYLKCHFTARLFKVSTVSAAVDPSCYRLMFSTGITWYLGGCFKYSPI